MAAILARAKVFVQFGDRELHEVGTIDIPMTMEVSSPTNTTEASTEGA
jgi:hypothetical protein